jgi:hypothetical protein
MLCRQKQQAKRDRGLKHRPEGNEGMICMGIWGTVFQVGKTASTKALMQEHAYPVCGTARRLFYLNE